MALDSGGVMLLSDQLQSLSLGSTNVPHLQVAEATPKAPSPAVTPSVNASTFFVSLTRHDYFLYQSPPNDILDKLRPQLPLTRMIQTIIWLLHHQPLGLPEISRVILPQLVKRITSSPVGHYFMLLDIRDCLWAESKIFELRWRELNLSNPERANLLTISQWLIKYLTEELTALEEKHPELASEFAHFNSNRLKAYPPTHPLLLIQPYLATLRAPLPDYSLYNMLNFHVDA